MVWTKRKRGPPTEICGARDGYIFWLALAGGSGWGGGRVEMEGSMVILYLHVIKLFYSRHKGLVREGGSTNFITYISSCLFLVSIFLLYFLQNNRPLHSSEGCSGF